MFTSTRYNKIIKQIKPGHLRRNWNIYIWPVHSRTVEGNVSVIYIRTSPCREVAGRPVARILRAITIIRTTWDISSRHFLENPLGIRNILDYVPVFLDFPYILNFLKCLSYGFLLYAGGFMLQICGIAILIFKNHRRTIQLIYYVIL